MCSTILEKFVKERNDAEALDEKEDKQNDEVGVKMAGFHH